MILFTVKNVGNVNCSVNNGGCQQLCTDLNDGGYYCSCRKGFILNSEDKNSCEGKDNHSTLSVCYTDLKYGGYYGSCRKGFIMNTECKNSCEGKENHSTLCVCLSVTLIYRKENFTAPVGNH